MGRPHGSRHEWNVFDRACDVFTYSFYHNFKPDDVAEIWDEEQNKFVLPGIPYTRTVYQALEEIKWIDEGQPDDTIFTPFQMILRKGQWKSHTCNAFSIGA